MANTRFTLRPYTVLGNEFYDLEVENLHTKDVVILSELTMKNISTIYNDLITTHKQQVKTTSIVR